MTDSSIDIEFTKVIRSIADLRQQNRASAIDSTYLFNELLQNFSLQEFRDYVDLQFGLKISTHRGRKNEYVDIERQKLKAYEKRFFSRFAFMDFLRIGFDLNNEHQPIQLWARLGNRFV